MTTPPNTLEDAIAAELSRFFGLHPYKPDDLLVQRLATAVNAYLGREGNAGLRDARRKEAVEALVSIVSLVTPEELTPEEINSVDAIIRKAQG